MAAITITASSVLADCLPPNRQGNRAVVVLPEGSSLLDVLGLLDLPAADRHLVTRNGELLLAEARAHTKVADGDEIGVFPPLKGG